MKKFNIVILVLPLLVFLNACSDPLPEFYGVYALKEGKLIQLNEGKPLEQTTLLSNQVSIIVYKKLLESNVDISKTVVLKKMVYVRNQIEHVLIHLEGPEKIVNTSPLHTFFSQDTIKVKYKPVKDKIGMYYVVPIDTLAQGIYTLTIIPNDIYYFSVGIGNIEYFKNIKSECLDLNVTTVDKNAPFSWKTWSQITENRVGKRKMINGNPIIKESFQPCSIVDNQIITKKLFEAVRENKIDEVKEYLSKGFDVNTKDKDGWTLLYIAVEKGNSKIVKLLLEFDADVNIKVSGPFGGTPLVNAMDKGYSEIVTLLNEAGAKLSIKENRDIIASNLNYLGSLAQQYYRKSISVGGGGYSFNGWHIPTSLSKNAFATYKIDKISQNNIYIIGVGIVIGDNEINPVKFTAYVKPGYITVSVNN